MSIRYYYLVLSQIDIFENQVLEEILRERANYYYSKGKNRDFWILVSPSFLKADNLLENIKKTNFYNQNKKNISPNSNKDYYGCIISLDKEFILWLQLRLGYFENLNQVIEKEFVSDGINGFFDYNPNLNSHCFISPLDNKINQLNPEIISKKYIKTLELYNLIS